MLLRGLIKLCGNFPWTMSVQYKKQHLIHMTKYHGCSSIWAKLGRPFLETGTRRSPRQHSCSSPSTDFDGVSNPLGQDRDMDQD